VSTATAFRLLETAVSLSPGPKLSTATLFAPVPDGGEDASPILDGRTATVATRKIREPHGKHRENET
jgi:hypothetical protein